MSLIKSVNRFSVGMGKTTIGGTQYWTWGSSTSISSTNYALQIYSPDGPTAKFCFIQLPTPINPHKSFLTWTFSGHGAATRQNTRVRIYGTNGYPPSSSTSFTQIQLNQYADFPVSSYGGSVPDENPEIRVEIVEFN
jgi:hypothetical protein